MVIDPLDDQISSIELLECMGTDLTVVNAARVSLDKHSDWEWEEFHQPTFAKGGRTDRRNPHLSQPDAKLIQYLADHNHWTPFGHPQLQFRIKMPIFVAREWYRHTIGFVRNEVSRRYVDSEPEFFMRKDFRLRMKTGGNKQGSSDETQNDFDSNTTSTVRAWLVEEILKEYRRELDAGIAPEVARDILPFNMYTEFYETASLYAYARLCSLRISPDAQKETRAYAEAVSSLIGPKFPVSWAALRKDR